MHAYWNILLHGSSIKYLSLDNQIEHCKNGLVNFEPEATTVDCGQLVLLTWYVINLRKIFNFITRLHVCVVSGFWFACNTWEGVIVTLTSFLLQSCLGLSSLTFSALKSSGGICLPSLHSDVSGGRVGSRSGGFSSWFR